MNYLVLQCLLIACAALAQAQPTGISSKLDFGSDSHSVGVVSGIKGTHGLTSLSQKSFQNVIKLDQDPPLEGIGVICVSGSCNNTKTTRIDSKEGVLTDVLVHVHTKVDLSGKNNSSSTTDDSAAIPVVVGYGGNTKPSTQSVITVNPTGPLPIQPVINPDSSVFDNPTVSISGSGNQPTFESHVFTKPVETNPVVVNLEEVFPETRRRTGSDRGSVYLATPNTFLGFNSPRSRPQFVDTRDDNVRYNSDNAIEVPVPYLAPSFNTHYFGENPPPQLLWHPKGRPVYNPLEFKEVYRYTPTWQSRSYQPNSIGNGRPLYQDFATPHVTADGKVCSCQNQNHNNPGLRWYPSHRIGKSHTISYNHQAHIDDKLAPLN